MAAFEEQREGIKEWYNRFNNIKIIDANPIESKVCEVVVDEVKNVLKAKESDSNKEELSESKSSDEESAKTRPATGEQQKVISKGAAEVLADQWATLETAYTDTIKFAFRNLRAEHDNMTHYLYDTKANFKKFLERPDKKQALLDLFQDEFNNIEDDLR